MYTSAGQEFMGLNNGVDEINHQLFSGYFMCSVFYLYKNHLFGVYLKKKLRFGGWCIFIHVSFFQVTLTRTVYSKHFLLIILEVSSRSHLTLFLADLHSSLVKNLHLPFSRWCNIPLA
jgi:hypothetical protein